MSKNQGRRNRQRGQEGEREVAGILSGLLNREVKRILGQERDGGMDIEMVPFLISVKRRKRIGNLYDWMKQLINATYRGNSPYPVLMLRADGERWLAVVPLEDWVDLCAKANVR